MSDTCTHDDLCTTGNDVLCRRQGCRKNHDQKRRRGNRFRIGAVARTNARTNAGTRAVARTNARTRADTRADTTGTDYQI